MAWIKVIQEGKTDDDHLRTLYKKYGDPFEGVDNILKIHSLDPEALRLHCDLSKHLMADKSVLSRMQREMIAVVVSAANNCHYCVVHHRDNLFQLTKNKSLTEAVATDLENADVADKDIAMMSFVDRLTRNPSGLRREDVQKLRDEGYKDREILTIVQVAAFYNYENRIALGLGVELEPRWD